MVLIHKAVPFKESKSITDKAGRYLILQGTYMSKIINLVNIYTPNEDNPAFFEHLFLLIASLSGTVIVAGDALLTWCLIILQDWIALTLRVERK